MRIMFRFRLGLMGITCGTLFSGCVDLAGPIPGTGGTPGNTSAPLNPSPAAGGTSGDTTPPVGSGQAGSGSTDAPVSFDEDVHPILADMCGGCHNADSAPLPGHGAADVDAAFDAVQAMSMGEPVYLRILDRASGVGGFMPPGCGAALGAPGCLSVEEFELIELWVTQGATNR